MHYELCINYLLPSRVLTQLWIQLALILRQGIEVVLLSPCAATVQDNAPIAIQRA